MAQTANTTMIREHMPVIDADGKQFATVDHLDRNDTIKLTRDSQGEHHWIPVAWVSHVDEHVHVDRPGNQVMQGWSTTAPA
jgi:hypothetical protein